MVTTKMKFKAFHTFLHQISQTASFYLIGEQFQLPCVTLPPPKSGHSSLKAVSVSFSSKTSSSTHETDTAFSTWSTDHHLLPSLSFDTKFNKMLYHYVSVSFLEVYLVLPPPHHLQASPGLVPRLPPSQTLGTG